MAPRPLVVPVLLAILLAVLNGGAFVAAQGEETCSGIVPMKTRGDVVSIADFGGVGDGRTLNTAAFQSAVSGIEQRHAPGGTLLYVPAGVWLTGAFNLTSHMTLFLAKGAIIKATQVILQSPVGGFFFSRLKKRTKRVSFLPSPSCNVSFSVKEKYKFYY